MERRTHNSEPSIGIFNDSFPPIIDGVTLTVQNYVRHLSRMGHKIVVCTPWNPNQEEETFDVFRYFSLPIRDRKPYRYGYPKADPFIWRKLRNQPFSIIHCHSPFSSGRLGLYAARKQGIPVVATFHSKYRSDLAHSFRFFKPGIEMIMRRILNFFNACDEVWIPQAQVEETVREYGYKGPLTVVENGIDYDVKTTEIRDIKRKARKNGGIPDNSLSLLFVGQHIREKGVETILDALKILDGKIDFRMNFVGEGYALDDMRKLTGKYGLSDRVTFNGIIRDRKHLADFYAAADLFLFPSFYDNAPLVVREAAAFGTPTLMLRGSTASEVITDETNGFLSGSTPEDFAESLIKIAENPEILQSVATGATSTLCRNWQDVVEEVADRYRVIIKNYHK